MQPTRTMLIVAAACALLFSSCKKDDETSTETQPSLTGGFFQLPSYGRVGQEFPLSLKGAGASDNSSPESISELWTANKDTVKNHVFKPGETGVYTIKCTYSCSGYYPGSYSRTLRIINPAFGKSLTDTGIAETDPHITDTRDASGENLYFYFSAGGLEWFRNNLAFTGSGIAFEQSDVTSYPLGRYYTWEEASTACPEGWRLPTREEFATFGTVAGDWMADVRMEGAKMWEFWPQVKITNASGFTAIPSGYATVGPETPVYKGWEDFAAFWTADTSESDEALAYYYYLHESEPDVMTGQGDKASLALSVRCVR